MNTLKPDYSYRTRMRSRKPPKHTDGTAYVKDTDGNLVKVSAADVDRTGRLNTQHDDNYTH